MLELLKKPWLEFTVSVNGNGSMQGSAACACLQSIQSAILLIENKLQYEPFFIEATLWIRYETYGECFVFFPL